MQSLIYKRSILASIKSRSTDPVIILALKTSTKPETSQLSVFSNVSAPTYQATALTDNALSSATFSFEANLGGIVPGALISLTSPVVGQYLSTQTNNHIIAQNNNNIIL